MLVLSDFQSRVERLVREPPVAVVRVRVGAVCVGQEPQAVVEECATAGVLFVVVGEAVLDVGVIGQNVCMGSACRGLV